MPTPDRDIELTLDVAQRLLADQQPALANLTPVVAGEGWDNLTIRIGDDLAMRLPRRSLANELIHNEQRWLPTIQAVSSIPLPAPVWNGYPTDYYPYAWSIVPWFSGVRASESPLASSETPAFAAFLRGLHVPASSDAPRNRFRNKPLMTYDEAVKQRLARAEFDRVDLGVDASVVRERWSSLSQAELDCSPTWVHGDLHPNNILTENRQLVSVIDWGDMTVGDPSVDLSSVWSLFDQSRHRAFWTTYGAVSRATRDRSRAWAIHFALLWILDATDVDQSFGGMGRTSLVRLCS